MWLGVLEAAVWLLIVSVMEVSFLSLSGCANRGLMAQQKKSLGAGAGKLKIGGDLQGEPIFCFPVPVGTLACQSERPRGAIPETIYGDELCWLNLEPRCQPFQRHVAGNRVMRDE